MKIWVGFSADHSARLNIVAKFKNENDAQKAEETLKYLINTFKDVPNNVDTIYENESEKNKVMDLLHKIMEEKNIISLSFCDVVQLLYFSENDVCRSSDTVTIQTDIHDIQSLIKILLEHGGKIEIYDRRDHPN
jgi:hypothetical protein